MNFPVFDLHCDTALALLGEDLNSEGSLRRNNLHIDLARANTLPGYCQCFACFTSPIMDGGVDPVVVFEREIVTVQRELDRNKDLMSLCYSAKQIEDNFASGKMSAVLTIEGPAGFGYNPEMLESLYQVGFRISTLGWNEQNELCGSNVTGGGLTDLGKAFVREAQRLGIVVDVSHISDEAFYDIMDITDAPIIATHSNSRALCPHSRNLTDDQFMQIVKTGGVAGINLYSAFLGEKPTIDTICDHIFHFLALDPTGKSIALGGDLDGCDELPSGFTGIQDYSKLSGRLLERGLKEDTVMDIFWNNALRLLK